MEAVTDKLVPQIADIRQHWHWVREGLEEILGADDNIYEIPEDVYASCMNGQTSLWVTDDYFVVTSFFTDRTVKGLSLLYAWAKSRGNKHSVIAHDFFEHLAESNGCEIVQSQTSHPQIADHFVNRLGYEVKATVLVKNLKKQG